MFVRTSVLSSDRLSTKYFSNKRTDTLLKSAMSKRNKKARTIRTERKTLQNYNRNKLRTVARNRMRPQSPNRARRSIQYFQRRSAGDDNANCRVTPEITGKRLRTYIARALLNGARARIHVGDNRRRTAAAMHTRARPTRHYALHLQLQWYLVTRSPNLPADAFMHAVVCSNGLHGAMRNAHLSIGTIM